MTDAPASVLSDGTILRLVEEGRIRIDPWEPALVQPASVDLRLGDSFRVFHNHRVTSIDLRDPPGNLTEEVKVAAGRRVRDPPGRVLPRAARSSGSSCPTTSSRGSRASPSLGRLGLIVHATAGFCDPGWKGTLTLELNNLTRVPIKLYPGLLIAQLSFMTLDRPALRPYGSPELGSHYQGQRAATESRYKATASPAARPTCQDRVGLAADVCLRCSPPPRPRRSRSTCARARFAVWAVLARRDRDHPAGFPNGASGGRAVMLRQLRADGRPRSAAAVLTAG